MNWIRIYFELRNDIEVNTYFINQYYYNQQLSISQTSLKVDFKMCSINLKPRIKSTHPHHRQCKKKKNYHRFCSIMSWVSPPRSRSSQPIFHFHTRKIPLLPACPLNRKLIAIIKMRATYFCFIVVRYLPQLVNGTNYAGSNKP